MTSPKNFYLDSVKGRPSAEAFLAMACVYSLLERKLDEYFYPYELTPVKFNALMLIKYLGKDHGISQNEICRHLIVTPGNITRLLDRLIKDGYIEKAASHEDRRVNLVKITPKGEEILDQVWHGYGELIQKTAYLLERKEVEELSALLLKWFAKLEESQESTGGKNGNESEPAAS